MTRKKRPPSTEARWLRTNETTRAPTARDAVRQSQRIAIQLHQLIAASITVTTLRSEQEILRSLAGSARAVFDADESVVTLETGSLAPATGRRAPGKALDL